jgi:hypothetical protein
VGKRSLELRSEASKCYIGIGNTAAVGVGRGMMEGGWKQGARVCGVVPRGTRAGRTEGRGKRVEQIELSLSGSCWAAIRCRVPPRFGGVPAPLVLFRDASLLFLCAEPCGPVDRPVGDGSFSSFFRFFREQPCTPAESFSMGAYASLGLTTCSTNSSIGSRLLLTMPSILIE